MHHSRPLTSWLAMCSTIGAAAALLATLPGCQKTEGPARPADSAAKTTPEIATDGAPDEKAGDIWEVFYLQDSKIGYGRTRIEPISRNGESLVEIDSLNHLAVLRFGQRAEQTLKTTSLETPAGQVIEFTTAIDFGPSPTRVRGHVEGNQMIVETQTQGVQSTDLIPWSSDARGFRAIEQSLEEQPLKPGQTRSVKMLMPVINQVAEVKLAAGEVETTSVLGIETRLLRIETTARLNDGNTISSTFWTDEGGQTIKTRVDALNQESFRTARAVALAEPPGGKKFDLGLDLIVKVDQPLAGARETRQAVYRVELTAADPAKVFASGGTQSVRSLGPHAAEVTVRSVRPAEVPPASRKPEPPAKEYTAANNVIQTGDPRIQAMAREAQGSATDPREVAVALERYVHRIMKRNNFTQAFATASEVAESREGDCSEHAVLLAALARACDIPSRVAIGLVWVESPAGFGYHMWTEMYLEGQWIPLDAVAGHGGTSAAYLKLTDSSLEGAAAYSSLLPIAQVIGQLKIAILSSR